MVDDRAVRFQPAYRPAPRPPAPRPGGMALGAMLGGTSGGSRGSVVPNAPVVREPVTSRTGTYGYTGREAPGAPPAGRTGGVTPAPTQPMAGGGGGGGGPRSMRDVDWFGQDSIFRTGAGGAQANLQDQLAALLLENQQGYQDIDRTRRDWGQQRDRGSRRTGEDFAARGLSQSGLYWQGLQDLLKDYEDSAGQINLREQNLAQQLGGRDPLSRLKPPADVASAMAMDEGMEMGAQMASPMATQATPGGFTQDALFDQNYNALADVYGLLGQRGVGEGNRYQAGLNQMRAQSAARSNQNIINTLGW